MKFRIFDVHAHPAEARQYLAGQRKALAAHGVQVDERESWLNASPGLVSFIAAYDRGSEMVGGIRVHFRPPWGRLPIEEYLGDPPLNAFLREKARESPAQVAGLWIHSAHGGTGLADFLILAGMAACRTLGVGWLCGCGHERMLALYRKYGARFDPSRTYAYPDERYVTYVLYMDLCWPEAPAHPARAEYLGMRMAFQQGRAWPFTPTQALTWKPPLAEPLPGAFPALATG
jgi:hypothetical protein